MAAATKKTLSKSKTKSASQQTAKKRMAATKTKSTARNKK